MTYKENTFEGLAAGTAITTANSGGDSGSAFDAISIPSGSFTVDQTQYIQGIKSLKVIPGSSASSYFGYTSAASTRVASRTYAYFTAIPTGSQMIFWLGIGNTRVVSVEFRSTGKIRVNDGSSSTSNVYSSTTNVPLNQWVRFETEITVGSSTTNGRIRFAMYSQDSTTPIDAVFDSSTLNFGTAGLTTPRWGAYVPTTDATPFWLDAIGYEDAATKFIGPYVQYLTTPVVTLGTKTDPTTVGGNEGKQTVTWPAVTDAVSYEAWIAIGSSPAQGDFTLVASNVTSPYQFVNLTAGTKAYGIKAKTS